MSGQVLVGLESIEKAELLFEEGLTIRSIFFKVFPYRKRAEKTVVGNLPIAIRDEDIVAALRPYCKGCSPDLRELFIIVNIYRKYIRGSVVYYIHEFEKFEALKRGLKSQQSLFTKVKTEQEAATRASFRVALEIAKRGKPFTDGEMIKECIIAVVEEMCPEKVSLLKTVSMSANTVARRVENIAENISSQLFDKNGHVEWFSLALDESTDVSDTAQVLIYIRGVDKSYEVHEELLDMYSIHGTTTGTDIFKGVEMAINKKNLRWKNLKCIITDGGKNMSGKDKGVVALVSKAVENDGGSKPLVLHCFIHQQSLCGKFLDMSDVLKPVISTVNFIRSFGLNHRQFRQFIAEIGETDLPYHTAVRWLSCGKVLQRFFELRAVIEIFLNEKHRPLTELQNNAWLWKLAFYVDLTKHVNELNLRLQGENQHLPDLYTNIKSFRMKLILFQSQLRSKCFSHFKTCEIFSHTTETEFPIDFAIETLSALKINFDTRFSDFDAIANQIKIFQNPFDADIETLAPELQMEMIDLQCSDIIKNKYENSSLLEFYKSLPLTQFDNLHKFARGLFSVFGTTYLCEKTFSKMKYTKNVYRSKLTDEHLKSLLIIGVLDRLRFLPIKKKDQRTCIKFCVKNEIKCADAFRMLTVAYGEATLDRSNVYRWYKMFSEGREDVNDEERAGRPSTSTTDEKINEVEKMILANRRITVREVAEDLNISIGSCHSIFINDLGMRRVAAKFVPKLLNCDQKQHRMNIANEMLDSVRDDPNLLQRVITGDEAWAYGYDVETKAQSSQWKLPHELRPKKARQVRSNVKVLLTVFFDCRGVVHHEFLPQGRTVNKEYYLQVMSNLREAIRQKRPDLWKNKNWLLHHDNAPAHTSLLVRDFLAKNNTLMMPQPPYSPDLAPCDFFLFPKLKRPMKGRRYATLDEIKTASNGGAEKDLKKMIF
ncbi:EPM2AIP1 [Cordylochernes scorpioides]|uniref:EPM2AIP1 n=1 Tax=Cordylochernes scorpioides TaxID=51811 RepID=A0ABY6L8D8_9ARAC|nr:EPM2AIP1 [Cordylochernes scorpioides]